MVRVFRLWFILVLLVATGCGSDDEEPDLSDELFDPTRIVEIEIAIPEDDWDELREQTRTLEALTGSDCLAEPFGSPFTYFEADVVVDGELFERVGLKKKGFFGSLDTTKPSLKIKFDKFVEGQEHYGFERLTLNNNRQDPSHIKQCLSYQAFAAAGIPSPRCNFAHVTVNGREMGIYTNVETLKKRFLGRHYDDDSGTLFEGTLSDFRSEWSGTFEPKTNKDAPDFSAIDGAIAVLEDSSDEDLAADLEAYIDLDQYMSYWAIEALIAHTDGYANNNNNFFLYHDPADGRLDFLPWGVDGTLREGNPFVNGGESPPNSVYLNGILARRLYDIPESRNLYFERLDELFFSVWRETQIDQEIDRMEALLMPLAADDPLHGTQELADTIAPVRDFVENRRSSLIDEINEPPEWDRPPRESFCFEDIGSISGTFDTTYGTLSEQNTFATGAGTLAGTIDGSVITTILVGSKSGLDPDDPTSIQIQVAAQVDATPGQERYLVFAIKVPVNDFGPGTHNLSFFGGVLIEFQPPGGFEIVGTAGDGSVILTQGSTADGAPVVGSFSTTMVRPPF